MCSYLSLALLAGVGLYAAFGWAWPDPVGALAMLPVILWQGWETLEQARDGDQHQMAGTRPERRTQPLEAAIAPTERLRVRDRLPVEHDFWRFYRLVP